MSKEINTVVEVSLQQLIDLDLEGFLDLLEELVLEDQDKESQHNYVLSDIRYKLESNGGTDTFIPIRVTGVLISIL